MGYEQPTQGQVKEFWERRGFRYIIQEEVVKNVIMPYGHWIDPEGNSIPDGVMLLPIDLNNLFEYAVPKDEIETVQFSWGDDGCHCWLYMKKPVGKPFHGNGETEALALFWARWEVFKNERVKVGNKEKEVKE